METSPAKMLKLKSADGDVFLLEEAAARKSLTLKSLIEDDCAGGEIPLPNVSSPILEMIIEYCLVHSENPNPDVEESDEEAIKAWDRAFVDVDTNTLFDLLQASNYLNVKDLLELLCQTVAKMIKGKTAEQIREFLHIENDLPPDWLKRT